MNHHKKHEHDKKSHNTHNQPHETRDALDKDLKASAPKLSDHVQAEIKPANEVKDAAVDTLGEAKDSAVEKLIEAKDTAVDTLVGAKDAALEKLVEAKDTLLHTKDVAAEKLAETKDVVAETLSDAKDATLDTLHDYKEVAGNVLSNVGEQARRVGDATWSFARQNALPLTVIGIGASWLIASGRRSSRAAESDATRGPRAKLSAQPRADGSAGHSTNKLQHRPSMRARHEAETDEASSALGDAAQSATQLAARAGRKAKDVYGRAEHAVLGGAAQGREFAVHQFVRARDGSREFIQENPLAVGAMALATGIGIGLLIPSTEPENALYGATRDRLVGEAREAASGVREAVQSVATVAKETASSLV